MRLLTSKPFCVFLIVGLGLAVYSDSIRCSFHFDDYTFIIDNYLIKSLSHWQSLWAYYPSRFITFLSLALNYHFNQLNVAGYHAFNIAVHLACGLLVWRLARWTMATPAMKGHDLAVNPDILALGAALVFVTHPLQTQAVTYIFQRGACLAALFYLASLCFYARSRLVNKHGGWFYGFSLAAAVAAMFTKENAVTLPVMIVLYEHAFFKTGRISWRRLWPLIALLLVIPVTMVLTHSRMFKEIQGVTEGPSGISSWHYFLTQLRVLVTYVRLVFLPVRQNVVYDYPVFHSLLAPPVVFSVILLCAIGWATARLWAGYRWMSFGVLWFFLALLPESSFLPLKDVIFEHRLYLPMVGFSFFLVGALSVALNNHGKALAVVIFGLVIVYAVLTYQRNQVWKNELTLWGDVVHKTVHQAGPYINRGTSYLSQGSWDEALEDFNKAIAIDDHNAEGYNDRGLVEEMQGQSRQAMADFTHAIGLDGKFEGAYFNRAILATRLKDDSTAMADFRQIIRLDPHFARAYVKLGDLLSRQGRMAEAKTYYLKAGELQQ